MDLYPDVMFANRMTRDDGLIFRFLRKLTRFQLRGAEAVVSLGPKMAEHVAAYATGEGAVVRGTEKQKLGKQKTEMEIRGQLSKFQLSAFKNDLRPPTSDSPPLSSRLTWVPLWSDPELAPWDENRTNPLRAERGWGGKDVVFLYSGNMGLGHRFGEFLEAAKRLGRAGPRWVFSGGGKRRSEIETFARSNPEARIEFLDYVPQSRLQAHLCAADVHLASLDSAWQGLIVPSKIQASFAAARPVLFVGGRQCETAAWIQESGGGWVVDQDDLDGLLKAIEQALNPDERQRRGQAALAFARKNFQMSENCVRIAQLLEGGSNGEKQKTEIRLQVSDQRSEVREQRSAVGKVAITGICKSTRQKN
jgi:glycosyltransferase involved in cell wall biosynthesis